MKQSILALCALLWPTTVFAEDVVLAVSSNFLETAETLAAAFEADTEHTVTIEHGATGLLDAQIKLRAPFDIFLAADAARPSQLLEDGLAFETATYAVGALVLLSETPITRASIADDFAGQPVVIADPILAPYGKAALSTMEQLGLDTSTFQPLVVANVAQVASVFAAGEAPFAFAAASSVATLSPENVLDLTDIAVPIRQDAALLDPDNPAAVAFWSWLFSEAGRALIADAGYSLP